MNQIECSRRDFMKLAMGGCCLALSSCVPAKKNAASGNRTNFVFIFTDDQGWQDLGCYGHPYLKTPNLDKLAKEGVRFEQFYVSGSVCSPSRVAFMTGHYPARHHIHRHLANHGHNSVNGMPDWLDPGVETVTRMLQNAGYVTGHFGKWHLGHLPGAPPPGEYGIDEHRAFVGTGPGWDMHGNPHSEDLALSDALKATSSFWAHSTDYFVDAAIGFLDKNKDRPFYLNLWTFLPHAPLRPTGEQLAVYKKLKPDPKDFDSWMQEYAADAKNLPEQMKTYAAAMTSVDKALGRFLQKLDALGLTENTVVFFTSDNGPEDYHVGNARNSGMGATGVFRGRKRSLYEGGIRMPCIARWPGRIPADRVDKTSVIAAVDWLPTVCSLAGVQVPDIKPDGEDISDILQGATLPRRRPLFWEWRADVAGNQDYKPPSLAIRQGDWKLFANPDGSRRELYNIPKDPEERLNVAERNPDVVAQLLPKLLKWKKTLPG